MNELQRTLKTKFNNGKSPSNLLIIVIIVIMICLVSFAGLFLNIAKNGNKTFYSGITIQLQSINFRLNDSEINNSHDLSQTQFSIKLIIVNNIELSWEQKNNKLIQNYSSINKFHGIKLPLDKWINFSLSIKANTTDSYIKNKTWIGDRNYINGSLRTIMYFDIGEAIINLLLDKYYPSVNLKNSGSDHPYIFIYNDNCDLKMDFQSEVRGS